MKPGFKTTEFWLSAVATVIGLLWASGAIAPDSTDPIAKAVGFVASALVAMGYSVSRGAAKKADAELESTRVAMAGPPDGEAK